MRTMEPIADPAAPQSRLSGAEQNAAGRLAIDTRHCRPRARLWGGLSWARSCWQHLEGRARPPRLLFRATVPSAKYRCGGGAASLCLRYVPVKTMTNAGLVPQTIAKANGLIKGRVGNPACDLPLREDGKLAVGAAVGAGKLSLGLVSLHAHYVRSCRVSLSSVHVSSPGT